MRLVYFASVRQRLGVAAEDVTLLPEIATARQLAGFLATRGGAYEAVFSDLAGLRVAIDQAHAGWDEAITGAHEVAIFPPVTGG